ncbi:hypothetical protein [Faecalibacter bovis]|uniref:Cytoplasmic protein n=1 Tax=Faecalibacter bovis TaxID=2898187 RepID=A0ABX7XDD0_9FLAO|nr:hypothetical protein [Faecalibacter bovis]QTV05887.1 hypothetical protein J9309_00620 [Faecalibacter bovis]
MKKVYTDKFLKISFKGCINNKTEILKYEICGCFNCIKVSQTKDIFDWIEESNGKEETATCPNCSFDSVLSLKYPIENLCFLLNMRKFHFG